MPSVHVTKQGIFKHHFQVDAMGITDVSDNSNIVETPIILVSEEPAVTEPSRLPDERLIVLPGMPARHPALAITTHLSANNWVDSPIKYSVSPCPIFQCTGECRQEAKQDVSLKAHVVRGKGR